MRIGELPGVLQEQIGRLPVISPNGNPYSFAELPDGLRRAIADHRGLGIHVIGRLVNLTDGAVLLNGK